MSTKANRADISAQSVYDGPYYTEGNLLGTWWRDPLGKHRDLEKATKYAASKVLEHPDRHLRVVNPRGEVVWDSQEEIEPV